MKSRLLTKITISCAALVVATACDVDFIAGPGVVRSGELVQYQILIKPALTGAGSDVTVYLTGDVPAGWSVSSSQFRSSMPLSPSGDITVLPTDPGVITGLPPIPSGHRRIYLVAGPFPAVSSDDRGTALLNFVAGGATGPYSMTFWAGFRAGANTGFGDTPYSLPLRVTAAAPPNTILADGFEDGTTGPWTRRGGVDSTTVLALPLDGNAADASIFGNDGTAAGDPLPGTDRFGSAGGALDFDGVDDQIFVPSSPSLDLVDGMTLAAWVQPDGGGGYIVGKNDLFSSGFLYSLGFVHGIDGQFRDAQGATGYVIGYLPVEQQQWQLLVFTWDGTDMVCYMDGLLVGHEERSGVTIGTGGGELEVGSAHDGRYRGTMDDLLIMNRALTFREVMQLLQ